MFTNLKISQDGDVVCVLYGENLKEGIAGFGSTEEEAMIEFCYEYTAKHKKKERKRKEILSMKIDNVSFLELKEDYEPIVLMVDDYALEMEIAELKSLLILIETYLNNFNHHE